jgi:hypothetical protein
MCWTAWTTSPVPASPLVRIMAAPFGDAAQGLAQVARAADKGSGEGVLVDVVKPRRPG